MGRQIVYDVDLQAKQFELCPLAGQPGKVVSQAVIHGHHSNCSDGNDSF